MIEQGIASIWGERSPLIGMIHLLPLPGSPGWSGRIGPVLERARKDARALTESGFDSLMVENFSHVPFLRGSLPPHTVASITVSVLEVLNETSLPVGVNVL